jgi:hypothetical protein
MVCLYVYCRNVTAFVRNIDECAKTADVYSRNELNRSLSTTSVNEIYSPNYQQQCGVYRAMRLLTRLCLYTCTRLNRRHKIVYLLETTVL